MLAQTCPMTTLTVVNVDTKTSSPTPASHRVDSTHKRADGTLIRVRRKGPAPKQGAGPFGGRTQTRPLRSAVLSMPGRPVLWPLPAEPIRSEVRSFAALAAAEALSTPASIVDFA